VVNDPVVCLVAHRSLAGGGFNSPQILYIWDEIVNDSDVDGSEYVSGPFWVR